MDWPTALFSPVSHWLLGNDSSLPSFARAVFNEYCMCSLAFGADHLNQRVERRRKVPWMSTPDDGISPRDRSWLDQDCLPSPKLDKRERQPEREREKSFTEIYSEGGKCSARS